MAAYYNEFDPYAAQWLRNLIAAGHIAPGDVDERSIEDVCPDDLKGYKQCHFFAGIGVWSAALRGIGWSDDRPIWTGSCPCQPFSTAGKGAGFDDERHLWPAFFHLITQCAPAVVVGEQVASKDGLGWLDLVQADLEGAGYASGAVDLCAAGVGAPHIRQRLWWVAHANADGRNQGLQQVSRRFPERFGGDSEFDGVGNAYCAGLQEHGQSGELHLRKRDGAYPGRQHVNSSVDGREPRSTSPTNGFWRDADWLFCRDGKWRPAEPGTSPLVNGASSRVGRLRAYGNAIVLAQAEAFLDATVKSLVD